MAHNTLDADARSAKGNRMIIRIIAASITFYFVISIVSVIVKDRWEHDRQMERMIHMMEDRLWHTERKPFSVTEYLDSMEKLHIDLHRQREAEKREPVVLWWGMDGMRINEDGTTEWISKRPEEEPEPAPTTISAGYIQAENIICTDILGETWTTCVQTPRDQLVELNQRLLAENIHAIQLIRQQRMGDFIRSQYLDECLHTARDIHGNIIRRYPN